MAVAVATMTFAGNTSMNVLTHHWHVSRVAGEHIDGANTTLFRDNQGQADAAVAIAIPAADKRSTIRVASALGSQVRGFDDVAAVNVGQATAETDTGLLGRTAVACGHYEQSINVATHPRAVVGAAGLCNGEQGQGESEELHFCC